MYYIIYAFFYLLSLLPWFVMYAISNFISFILYHIIKYRKNIILNNLAIVFPEKSIQEREKICKQFYKNFVDTFIETIKCISISKKQLNKRFKIDTNFLQELYNIGKPVQFHTGHFFNWEYLNASLAIHLKHKWVGVYSPLSNKSFDRLIYNMRSRFGTILIPTTHFKTKFHEYAGDMYALGLAADQNPGNINNAYWLPFFGKMAPFARGPEKGAKLKNTTVVFANFYRIKRGHYKIDFELITTNAREYADGELTKMYVSYIENCIKQKPDNYLWSHKRWKHQFNKQKFEKLVVK